MTVLVSDSFNRANTTSGLGTTDSYNGGTNTAWQSFTNGVWGINNNQAYLNSFGTTASGSPNPSDPHDFQYVQANQANVQLDLDINYSSTSISGGIGFRAINDVNFWQATINSTGLLLYKYVSDTSTKASSYTFTPVTGSTYHVTVVANGSSITVSLNGTQQISVTDSANSTGTLHGLRSSYAGSVGMFDNFQISDLNTGQTTTYVGVGSITSSASLTSASHIVLSDGRSINGNSSLTSGERFYYVSSGGLAGQSNLVSNEYMSYLASGTLQSVSSLGSADSYSGATGTRYSGMGNILSFSSLSSGEIEKYSGLGSISSIASLIGNAGHVIEEKGNIQAVSILDNPLVNTIFNVHGDINTVSFLSSGDLLNGVKNPQQYLDSGIILMHTGLLSHEELIHFAFPVYRGEEFHINGIRKMNVYVVGKQNNLIYLKGVRK